MKESNNVEDIIIDKNTKIIDIVEKLHKSGGFQSRNLADSVDVLYKLINDKKCLKFLSFVGSIISTGCRGIIKEMIKNKMFDVIITTCGALDHDIARYYSYYQNGSFNLNDKKLIKNNIHRLGNVLIPVNNYGKIIENNLQKILEEAYKKNKKMLSTTDITKLIGSKLGKESFLYWAYKNEIPVIVPGIMDGAVGSQIWLFNQKYSDFQLDIVADSNILSKLIFKSKISGALMLGGGISKHHTLWWNQYKSGLDYAVYITTAEEFDGSLSGAVVEEAISWGKVAPNAMQTTVHGEITTILPFLYSALLQKLKYTQST